MAGQKAWIQPACATSVLCNLDATGALLALDEMWKLQAEVNVFHISAVVAACGKDSKWQTAWQLLFHRTGALRLDVVTFNSLVRCCAKANRWDSAVQVLSAMSGCDLPPTDKTRSTAAAAIASASLWQESLSLTILCNESEVASNTLITSCGRCCRWRLAEHVADGMAMAAMQPDLVTITAVLTGYTSGSQWQQALRVQELLVAETFDAVVYSSLMMACSEGILWKDSLQLLQEMSFQQCLPDLFSYSALISSCSSADQWQLALAIFQEFAQDHRPNVVVCSATMAAVAKGSLWQDVLDMLITMPLTREDANEVSLMAALDACGRGANWQAAMMLMASCQSLRIQVSQRSYTVALGTVIGLWEQCVNLISTMRRYGMAPNEIPLSATTLSCERSACWSQALSLLADRAESITFLRLGSAMGACENVRQWKRAMLLLHGMRHRQLESNVLTYTSALSACAAAEHWPRTLGLWGSLSCCALSPSVATGSAVLSACEKSSQWIGSLRMLREMQCRHFQPEDLGIKASVLCCSRGQHWSFATQLSRMLQAPSSLLASYAYIANACESLALAPPLPTLLERFAQLSGPMLRPKSRKSQVRGGKELGIADQS